MTADHLLRANLRWFIEHLDTPPSRIHVRGVWHDSTGGSAIGSPMTAREFADWLQAGERSVRTIIEDVPCLHPSRPEYSFCPDCVIYAEDGTYAGERGTVRRRTEVYRWPMRAAMARLSHFTVPAGRPNFAVALHTLARFKGDVAAAASALAIKHPAMGDDEVAVAYFRQALQRCRDLYRDVPMVRFDPPVAYRSEAQLDAEAAAPDEAREVA